MIIVLNGCAASGKGTLARGLANNLGLPHYDFGLLFRGIAFAFEAGSWDLVSKLEYLPEMFAPAGYMTLCAKRIAEDLKSEAAGLSAARLAGQHENEMVSAAKQLVLHANFVADGRTVSQ